MFGWRASVPEQTVENLLLHKCIFFLKHKTFVRLLQNLDPSKTENDPSFLLLTTILSLIFACTLD